MGFFKWLISQYRAYKIEKAFPKKSQAQKDCDFMNAYYRCVEAGFTTEQINSIITLFCLDLKN